MIPATDSNCNKKIMFIVHHFPPMGGPGVNRSLQFVSRLTKYGYQVTVLTITEKNIADGIYPVDQSLLQYVPNNIEILRISTGEPVRLKKVLVKGKLYRLAWFFLYPLFWETSALWPFKAWIKARKVIRDNNIPLIYTSSGPFSPMLLAVFLKITTKCKWVSDLRDPYTDGYMWIFPSKIHWFFSRLCERAVLFFADKVIVNTPEVMKLYLKRKLVKKNKITCITNGF